MKYLITSLLSLMLVSTAFACGPEEKKSELVSIDCLSDGINCGPVDKSKDSE